MKTNWMKRWRNTGACCDQTAQSAVAQFGAGSVLQRKRQWATPFYAAALRLNPSYAEVENNLGLMRMESSGDAAGAAAHYRAALRMNEEYAEAHNNLGLALSAAGDWDGAIEHYRRAVALNPTGGDAIEFGRRPSARRGRTPEAKSAYEEFLQAHPDNFEAHYALAGLLARAGQFQPARDHLETAVRLRPIGGSPLRSGHRSQQARSASGSDLPVYGSASSCAPITPNVGITWAPRWRATAIWAARSSVSRRRLNCVPTSLPRALTWLQRWATSVRTPHAAAYTHAGHRSLRGPSRRPPRSGTIVRPGSGPKCWRSGNCKRDD